MLTLCYIHHKTSSNSNIILVFNSYPGFPAKLLLLCNVSQSFSFIVRNLSSSRIICPTSKQKVNHTNIKIQIKILMLSSKKRQFLEKSTKTREYKNKPLVIIVVPHYFLLIALVGRRVYHLPPPGNSFVTCCSHCMHHITCYNLFI